jgi:colanic acid/amylovoran biosynthesis glycosyltransferase
MVQKKVAHFVRKFLPSKTSFIRNQISSHVKYIPVIVFKEYVDSDFAEEIKSVYDYLFLEEGKMGIEMKYSALVYNRFRKITARDVFKTLSYLKNNNIKILHFHYGTDASRYLEIIKSSKLPSVVSFYGYDCSSFPRWYFGYGKRCLSKLFRHIDFTFAMSEDMRNDLIKLGCPEDKIIIHYYGTDIKNFYYKREYREKEKITLLMVSSLDEKKGHIYILKALERLERSIKSKICFRIVGDGPLDKKLKNYVKKHGLDKIVTFVGSLKYLSKEFLEEFYNADIFMHPSVVASNGDKDGIPGTIIEAMATGLPVISTYHAGIPYVINHRQTGYLVKERDVSALTEYICEFVEDVNLRKEIGQKAQQYALRKLDLKQKQIELENIYDFVIESQQKRK